MPKTPGSKPARDTSSDIDAGLVREIALLLSETDLSEIEVERGDLRIRVARQTFAAPAPVAAAYVAAPPAMAVAAPAAPAAPEHDHADVLKSPMVGTVYLPPEPGVETLHRDRLPCDGRPKGAAGRGDEDVQRHCRPQERHGDRHAGR